MNKYLDYYNTKIGPMQAAGQQGIQQDSDLISRLLTQHTNAKVSMTSGEGADNITDLKVSWPKATPGSATSINAATGPSTSRIAGVPTVPTPQSIGRINNPPTPAALTPPPPSAPAPIGVSAIDQQGMYGTLAQILAGFGSGFLDKDNPAQAIGATAAGVGRNLAYNAALKKQLAAILGEGGNSNF